jgi:hypothetical protein
MAWLVGILEMILKLVVPILVKEIFDKIQDGKELSDWKKAEQAKLELAAKKYKEELKGATDEQAQKDAFDKLVNSSR